MEFVKIAHPDIEGEGECALSALPLWVGLGWHRVEPASQQPQVIDLPPTTEKSEPSRAPESQAFPKASRRGATTEE